MTEELENITPSEEGQTSSTDDLLNSIKELKENTVSKEEYSKLQGEYKKVLNAYVNNQALKEIPIKEKKNIEELRKDFFTENQNNLDYIKSALALRQGLIDNGDPDPFLPLGQNIMPTDDDIQKANKVATVLQQCVDYAEGDSSVFTNELQRRLVDIKKR